MNGTDVAIIGGGICGTSAAAFLAEAGVKVSLFERADLAAGASGRNSGALQRPLDGPLGELHRETLELYRSLTLAGDGFELADGPAGLLMVSPDDKALAAVASDIRKLAPDLQPEMIPAGDHQRLEPQLAPDLGACRLATGYPVAPAAATLAFARRAVRAGAIIETGSDARPAVDSRGRLTGVNIGSRGHVPASQVLLAAGPWTSNLIAPWMNVPPIRPLWGAVVAVDLADPPRHVIEELGIDGGVVESERLFSLVSADGATSVGSIFTEVVPVPEHEAPMIIERAVRFLPALSDARIVSVRACARPLSFDGRPLIGPVDGSVGLFVCAGHGPWGISTGPASARLVVDQMLGRTGSIPEFDPARGREPGWAVRKMPR